MLLVSLRGVSERALRAPWLELVFVCSVCGIIDALEALAMLKLNAGSSAPTASAVILRARERV